MGLLKETLGTAGDLACISLLRPLSLGHGHPGVRVCWFLRVASRIQLWLRDGGPDGLRRLAGEGKPPLGVRFGLGLDGFHEGVDVGREVGLAARDGRCRDLAVDGVGIDLLMMRGVPSVHRSIFTLHHGAPTIARETIQGIPNVWETWMDVVDRLHRRGMGHWLVRGGVCGEHLLVAGGGHLVISIAGGGESDETVHVGLRIGRQIEIEVGHHHASGRSGGRSGTGAEVIIRDQTGDVHRGRRQRLMGTIPPEQGWGRGYDGCQLCGDEGSLTPSVAQCSIYKTVKRRRSTAPGRERDRERAV